jgi:four helix bundle protein
MNQRSYDLEERLVKYSCQVMEVVEALPVTKAASYIAGQLIRCGLAPALMYGEAQSSESRDDFIHKMKIGVKELKETRICFKMIIARKMVNGLEAVTKENEELIAIISKSIATANKNKKHAS